jgi:adenylate kinase
MRVAVTGTPGTGKTTATALLADRGDFDLDVAHLNDLVREHDFTESTDEARDSLVVDLDAVREHLADEYGDDLLVESHLAHLLDAGRVVVLRAHPERIEQRLRERGEPDASARENAQSEALDVVLSEAVDRHGPDSVYEVDTTDRDPEAVADAIAAVVRGEREPSAGRVDFTDYLVGDGAPAPSGFDEDGATDEGGAPDDAGGDGA